MSDVAETLDPLRLPLQGERLIEASAGTGKTFTIAALYLRLHLILDVFGIGYRRQLLLRAVLQNACGIVHVICA